MGNKGGPYLQIPVSLVKRSRLRGEFVAAARVEEGCGALIKRSFKCDDHWRKKNGFEENLTVVIGHLGAERNMDQPLCHVQPGSDLGLNT